MFRSFSRSAKLFSFALLGLLALSIIPSFTSYTAAFNIPNGDVNALKAAINQANASSGKDEINLAPGGTYNFNAEDNEFIEIISGELYAYGPNALPQINSNITINGNGAILQRDPLFSSCNDSNELRTFWVNETGKLTLNNVVMKNGCVGYYGTGGAVFARGGTLTILGSTFENNNVTGIVLSGGAVGVEAGFLFVEQSTFNTNSSTYEGGAITLDSATGVVFNSNFTGNAAAGPGGAISADSNADVTIYGGTFTANNATSGGGVATSDASKMRILGATFISNSTVYDGGAAFNDDSTMIIRDSTFTSNMGTSAGAVDNDNGNGKLYIFNSTFTENTAENFGGGALTSGGAELYVLNSTFTGNTSPDTDFGGGAIYHSFGKASLMNVTITGSTTNAEGGAIYSSGDNLYISGSTITGNTARDGGGLETYLATAAIHSTTFSNNTADTGDGMFSGYGGAILSQANTTIVNSTFNGNTASGYESLGEFFGAGGAIFAGNNGVDDPVVTIINSTISGNTSGTHGGGIFVDEYGDLELQNVTITGNTAELSGGAISRTIDDIFPEDAAVINIARSILASNNAATGDECDDENYVSAGNNVFTTDCDSVAGDTTGVGAAEVLNTTLANNGGFTSTHALIAGSPAINKGGTGCPMGDQRGYTRDANCDAGAFEFDAPFGFTPGVIISPSGGSVVVNESGTNDTYTFALGSAPTSVVTVNIFTDGEVNASPSTLVFTPQNWSTPQTVTVSAVVDFLIEGEHNGIVGHAITSNDPMYNAYPAETVLIVVGADTTGGGDPTETPNGPTATPTATLTPEPEGELTGNGGFEEGTGGGAGEWSGKNLSGDKRKCNKPDKTFAFTGQCAYQFKGGGLNGAAEKSQIVQKQQNLTFAAGDTLALSAWVNAKSLPSGAQVMAKLSYSDTTKGKITLDVDTGTYSYKQIVEPIFTLEKPVTSLKLSVRNRAASGKFLIDDVSLVHTPLTPGISNDQMGLLTLPTAEANGRGQ